MPCDSSSSSTLLCKSILADLFYRFQPLADQHSVLTSCLHNLADTSSDVTCLEERRPRSPGGPVHKCAPGAVGIPFAVSTGDFRRVGHPCPKLTGWAHWAGWAHAALMRCRAVIGLFICACQTADFRSPVASFQRAWHCGFLHQSTRSPKSHLPYSSSQRSRSLPPQMNLSSAMTVEQWKVSVKATYLEAHRAGPVDCLHMCSTPSGS